MLALVIVLLVTNVVTIAALVVALRVRLGRESHPEPELADALPPARGPAGTAATRGRRVISIEIHNPIELAGHRNRMFGIAGSFVPDLTRRLVYDQTARLLRERLAEHQVVADVRVHAFAIGTPPARVASTSVAAMSPEPPAAVAELAPLASEFADEDVPDRLAD